MVTISSRNDPDPLPKAPSLLFVTTCWWASLARLAHLFQTADIAKSTVRVSILCPRGHPAVAVSNITVYRHDAFHPARALSRAIAACGATVLVPGDDRSVAQLHALHASGTPAERRLVERSLGDPAHYAVARSRVELLATARSLGMAVPAGMPVRSAADLARWTQQVDAPWVIKVDGASNGLGVSIARDRAAAGQALHRLSQPPRLARALKRAIINRDPFRLAEWRAGVRPRVSVQAFVPGRPGQPRHVLPAGRGARRRGGRSRGLLQRDRSGHHHAAGRASRFRRGRAAVGRPARPQRLLTGWIS